MEPTKIKVLHLITNLPPGGAQDNTIFTVNLHDKERYEVWLATMPGGTKLAEVNPEVKIRLIPTMRWEISPWFDFLTLVDLYRFIRKERFDIVHTHISKAGILGRFAAWLARTPIVVHTIHTFAFHDFQPKWKNWLYIMLERIAARMTYRLVAVSSLNIDKSLQYNIGQSEQFSTIYSGIELSKFELPDFDPEAYRLQLGLDPDRPIVGVVGRLTFQKNPTCFVRAVSLLADRYPDVQFVLVGDGELREEVEQLRDALGLKERLILLGHRADTPQIFSCLDIVAHTSFYEGMGRVFAEAMACSKPIVATDVDGVAEAVDGIERGLLVPPNDPEALAEALSRLLDDRNLAMQMGQRGQAWVKERFEVRQMVRQIEALYERSLYEKAPSRALPLTSQQEPGFSLVKGSK